MTGSDGYMTRFFRWLSPKKKDETDSHPVSDLEVVDPLERFELAVLKESEEKED